MTENEFYAELGKLKDKYDWEVTPFGTIRAEGMCPISALGGEPAARWEVVQIRLDPTFISCVVDAADNFPYHDPLIRKKLLSVLGLEKRT